MSGQIIPSPGSAEYKIQIEKYDEDIRPQQYAGVIVCTFAATVAVALRLYSQMKYRKKLSWDDWLIVAALVIVYAQMIASILSMEDGAGLHQVRVLQEDQNAPYGLQHLYTNYWIVSVLWAPAIMCIKLSILIVYGRLFLVSQRWFKIALWANAAYAAGLGIAATFIFIFQCLPVDYYWTRFIAYYGFQAPEGKCLPQLAHLVTPQILSTASDLVILVLPMPIIWRLHVANARKAALLVVFLLGAFTVGCGIARISVIFHVSNVADVTWNNIDTVTFTVVECGVGIVCACLPPSAPVYTAIMRRYGLMPGAEPTNQNYLNKPTTNQRRGLFSNNNKSSTGDEIDLEFQGLVPGHKAQAWSHNGDTNKRGESESEHTLTHDSDMIRVDHKVEWSSTDIGEAK